MTTLRAKFPSGFTLMELMVAVALLVGVIVSVGMIFQGTSRTVGLSQATSDMMSGVRAINSRIEKDLAGLDSSGFLVIRSRLYTPPQSDVNPDPWPRRYDQIAFLSNGTFRNSTGAVVGGSATFVDRSFANAARIWYGQLVVAADGATVSTPDGTYYQDQSVSVPRNALPTGVGDSDLVLGRHVTALFPDDGWTGSGSTITSVESMPILALRRNPTQNIRWAATDNPAILAAGMPKEEQIDLSLTSSRCAAAGYTSTMIMNSIIADVAANGGRANGKGVGATWEADNYCYRFRVLPDLWSNSFGSVVNGYYRMHPIFQKCVPSFAVDWTDGSCSATGELRWYGLTNPKRDALPSTSVTEPAPSSSIVGGDDYVAQFSFDSKGSWPKALRFTYRITDPGNRLAGGRTFVQIVALAQ